MTVDLPHHRPTPVCCGVLFILMSLFPFTAVTPPPTNLCFSVFSPGAELEDFIREGAELEEDSERVVKYCQSSRCSEVDMVPQPVRDSALGTQRLQ